MKTKEKVQARVFNMVFTKAMTFDKFKGKIYIHNSGDNFYLHSGNVFDCLSRCEKNSPSEAKQGDYFISLLWSNAKEEELIDFFVYSGLKDNWYDNPEISSWVITNGIWSKKNPITCGEGIILLGEEEKLRRKTNSLEEYLKKGLNLDEINKAIKRL